MKEVHYDGKTVAIFHRLQDWKEGLDFLTQNETYIQAGTWWYQAGKNLKAHIHIENKRAAEFTQEVIVVVGGRLRVDLYSPSRDIFHQEELRTGDMGVILAVGHGYQILDPDTKVVEIKNGPFISVEKDKVLI